MQKAISYMVDRVLNMPLGSQPAFTYSELTTETLEQGVQYVQSWIYFTPCSSVSIVNFKHVNADCDDTFM